MPRFHRQRTALRVRVTAMKRGLTPFLLPLLFLLGCAQAEAADYYARTAGAGTITNDWNLNTTWTASATCNGPATAGTPGAGDNVFICSGKTVNITANAAAASVTFLTNTPAGGTNSSLVHAAGVSLTVGSGGVTINGSNAANGTRLWNIGSGSASVAGSVTLNGGSNNSRIARIDLTSGTLTIGGDLAYSSANAARAVINTAAAPASAQINLAGAFTVSTTGTLDMGTGDAVFNYNGTAAQTVRVGVSSIVYRNLHLNNSSVTGATLSAAISATNVTGNLRVQNGILNNGGFAIVGGAGDTFELADGTRLVLTGTAGMATGFSTFSLGTTPGNMSVVSFEGGNQAMTSGITYGEVNVAGTGTKTPAAGTISIAGNLTINPGVIFNVNTSDPTINIAGNLVVDGTYSSSSVAANALTVTGDVTIGGTFTGNGGAVNLAGDFTNNGTFTSGTGTFTFNGTSAQSLGGTASTFSNFRIDNASGVALGVNVTVNTALTFSNGRITTGANRVILGTAATVTTPSAASYVVGTVQKNYASAGTLTFPVGDAGNYTPVVIQGTAGFTSGNLTVTTTASDHPQITTPIATTSIDAAKSVNRYWTLTASGLPATSTYNATFNYISGSPVDLDAGVTPANFIVQSYDGTNWVPTVLSGTPTTTSAAITGATQFGDFAVGEPRVSGLTGTPGQFNAFDTATPAGAVIGYIQTKQSGVSFSVRLVRLNAARNAVDTAYNQTGVTVELLDSSDNSGTMSGTTACRPIGTGSGTWQVIAGTTQTVNFASGVATASFTVTNSYRDARVHVVKTGVGAGEGCSTDHFAIRPQSLTVSAHDADWATAGTSRALNNTGATGGNVHKAATASNPLPFTLRVTPVPATATNYNGSPTVVAGFPACGSLCATVGTLSYTVASWTGAGVRENNTANYSEAGTFNLQLEDTAYASVDAFDGSTAATRTVPSTATVEVGRFVPDHFAVTAVTQPRFRTFDTTDAACTTPSRSFTYIGQFFGYETLPVAMIAARNAAGDTTVNYRGTLWKLSGASVSQSFANSPAETLDLSQVSTPSVAEIPASGTGTLTAGAGDKIAFVRDTASPRAPFNANLSLTWSVTDAAEAGTGQGTIGTPAPLVFNGGGGGIAFDSGAQLRYGRLRLGNANGSQLVPLLVPLETQYFAGAPSNAFVTNTADHCTSLAAGNVELNNYTGNLNACETSLTVNPFGSGRSSVLMSAPGSGNNGSVTLTARLEASVSGATTCIGGASTGVVGANRLYLQGNWTGTPFTENPSGRVTFGVYRGSEEVIFIRENF
jgi:hypothetical protein